MEKIRACLDARKMVVFHGKGKSSFQVFASMEKKKAENPKVQKRAMSAQKSNESGSCSHRKTQVFVFWLVSTTFGKPMDRFPSFQSYQTIKEN